MNKIRITGGNLKGRSISVAEGYEARYTSAKVREAVFNMIGDVTGKRVLDLFGGSGSFAIEALSRGADFATVVEHDAERIRLLRLNLEHLMLNRCCQVLDMDVIYAVPFLCNKGDLHDIIFMDPPYEKGYLAKTMQLLERHVIYHDNTFIIMEHAKREQFSPEDAPSFVAVRTKKYGSTWITFLSRLTQGAFHEGKSGCLPGIV